MLITNSSKMTLNKPNEYVRVWNLSTKKGAAYATFSLYVAAINKFYSINDITLNWKKISSFMGEHEKVTDYRPYTHSEIQTLRQNCVGRNCSMILLMSSAGLRIGALSTLRDKDLEPIDLYITYKVNVYAKSKKSNYFSFCSPEARREIDCTWTTVEDGVSGY